MDREEILRKVVNVIADQIAVDVNDLDENTAFEDDLDADSLDLLQIVTAIEDEFNVSVEDEDFEGVKTVGDAIDYIQKII